MWNIPNIMTLGRLCMLPVLCWMIWPGVETRFTSFWAGLLYGAAGALDVLDGYLARKLNAVTLLGKFLDPLADKLYLLVTLIALMQLPGERVPAWIVMFILTRELAITGLRGIAAAQGVVIDAGQEGKIKTVFVTVGTCALIMHYDYYIDVGFYQGVISCMEIGLLMTYISLAYSTISAFDYTRAFIKASEQIRPAS